MATNSVEEIKQKVDRLIVAYQSNLKELEELRAENSKLRNTLSQNNSTDTDSFEKEQLRKKVDALISEVDKCVKIMAK